MSVEILGAGAPVLMLHGLSANRCTWTAVARRLAPTFQVILPDLLGRGESTALPTAGFRLRDDAGRIAELLDRLEVTAPFIVGHSYGAAIAVAVATDRMVRGLLLVSPVSPGTRRPPILTALRFFPARAIAVGLVRLFRRRLTRYILERRVYSRPGLVDSAMVGKYAEPYRDPSRAGALTRALAEWQPRDLGCLVERLDAPAHVLTGEFDRRISVEAARGWADTIGAGCTVLAGCGHGLPEEAPDEVARHLLRLSADINTATRGGPI